MRDLILDASHVTARSLRVGDKIIVRCDQGVVHLVTRRSPHREQAIACPATIISLSRTVDGNVARIDITVDVEGRRQRLSLTAQRRAARL